MPDQVQQPITWRQVLMVALPKQTGADSLDEHRYLSAGDNEQMASEDSGGKNEATSQTGGGARSISHDRIHARLADECGDRNRQGIVVARQEIWAQFGDRELGHSAMLRPYGRSPCDHGTAITSSLEVAGERPCKTNLSSPGKGTNCGRKLDI